MVINSVYEGKSFKLKWASFYAKSPTLFAENGFTKT